MQGGEVILSKPSIPLSALLFGAALLLSCPSLAAESNRFEATVFGGYAFGGSLENTVNHRAIQIEPSTAFGVTLDLAAREVAPDIRNAYYEVTYRKQTTMLDPNLFGIDVENLHVGGRIDLFSANARV